MSANAMINAANHPKTWLLPSKKRISWPSLVMSGISWKPNCTLQHLCTFPTSHNAVCNGMADVGECTESPLRLCVTCKLWDSANLPFTGGLYWGDWERGRLLWASGSVGAAMNLWVWLRSRFHQLCCLEYLHWADQNMHSILLWLPYATNAFRLWTCSSSCPTHMLS